MSDRPAESQFKFAAQLLQGLDADDLADETLKLENQLCFALYASSRAITQRYREYLQPLGLTYPQYLVMMVLWERQRGNAAIGVKALGEKLYLDSGTLTPLLKRLETTGLLLRQRSSKDERLVEIQLTEAGLMLKERAANIPLHLLCELDQPLEKLLQLKSDLRSLLETLQENR